MEKKVYYDMAFKNTQKNILSLIQKKITSYFMFHGKATSSYSGEYILENWGKKNGLPLL